MKTKNSNDDEFKKEELIIPVCGLSIILILWSVLSVVFPNKDYDALNTSSAKIINIESKKCGIDFTTSQCFIAGDSTCTQQLYFSYNNEGKAFNHSLNLIDQNGNNVYFNEENIPRFQIYYDVIPNDYGIPKEDVKRCYRLISNYNVQYICIDFIFKLKNGASITLIPRDHKTGKPILKTQKNPIH